MDCKQRYAILAKNKAKLLREFGATVKLTDDSGIYVLTRTENGISYGYVGQSVHVLTRLAEHLSGYQHIDLSIKKHGLYNVENNPTGYTILTIYCPKSQLDELEQFYIKQYANAGVQLRNHTTGSQGVGKKGIDGKASRGYYDGKQQGKDDLIKEVQRLLKYIDVAPKGGKLSERMYEKFLAIFSQNS